MDKFKLLSPKIHIIVCFVIFSQLEPLLSFLDFMKNLTKNDILLKQPKIGP